MLLNIEKLKLLENQIIFLMIFYENKLKKIKKKDFNINID